MKTTRRDFTLLLGAAMVAPHAGSAQVAPATAFSVPMQMQPEWERSGQFGGRRPLHTNGLLISDQRFDANPPISQIVALRLEDGSDVWKRPGNVSKRIVQDENNFYCTSFVQGTRTYKLISASIASGNLNWESELGGLVSLIRLDGTQITALTWFDDVKGFFIYTVNAADGVVTEKKSIAFPTLSSFWFANNGDIVIATGGAGTVTGGGQSGLRILAKPYGSAENAVVVLQRDNLTIFEGIFPAQCFFATDLDSNGVSSFGRIDLESRKMVWEVASTSKFWGVFEENDKIVALQYGTNASVFTRYRQSDGKVIWQTIIPGIRTSIHTDDGVYVQKYLITGGPYSDSGWASKTFGINVDDGRVLFSIQRNGNLTPTWAFRNGDMAYVHTANGIAAINPDRFWRRRYAGFRMPVAVRGAEIVATTSDSRVLAVDLATGRQDWSRSVTDTAVCSPSISRGRAYLAGQNSVRAFELGSGNDVWTCAAPEGVTAMAAIGELIVYAGRDKKLRAIDRNKTPRWTIDRLADVSESGFAHDTDRVYFADNSGVCYGYALDGDPTKGWPQPQSVSRTAIRATPLVAGERIFFADTNGQLIMLGRANGAAFPVQNGPPGAACVGMSLTPAADAIICADADGVVRSRQVDDGREIWKTPSLGSLRNAPAIAGGEIFVGTDTGTVVVLDATSGKTVRSIDLGGRGQAFTIAHPDAIVAINEAGFMEALLP